MTYWARDHQLFVRRIQDVMAALDAQIEILDSIRQDLATDDHDLTEDARARGGEARKEINAALNSLELMLVQLPAPRPESELFANERTI